MGRLWYTCISGVEWCVHDCTKYSQLDEVSSFSNAAHGAHISYADKLTNWRTTSVLYTSETIRKQKLAILDEIKS